MPDNAQILVNIYDGTRQPLAGEVKWLARLSDGRSLSARKTDTYDSLQGPSKLFSVKFFDNFFDDYTVVVLPDGYDDSGWFPVRVHPTAPAIVDILALPKAGQPHFADATWQRLRATRPGIATIVQRSSPDASTAESKYGLVLEN